MDDFRLLELLESTGMTPAEARVYLVTLTYGPCKAGRIIERSGLQSSTVHNTLNTLIIKGLVTHTLIGKVKQYSAVEPERLLSMQKDKLMELSRVVPQLHARSQHERLQAEIFVGLSGFLAAYSELVDTAGEGRTLLFFSASQPGRDREIQREYFERIDRKSKDLRLKEYGVARHDLREHFAGRPQLMRYFNEPIPENVTIMGGRILLYSWVEQPQVVLVQSKQLADSWSTFFWELWKRGEK